MRAIVLDALTREGTTMRTGVNVTRVRRPLAYKPTSRLKWVRKRSRARIFWSPRDAGRMSNISISMPPAYGRAKRDRGRPAAAHVQHARYAIGDVTEGLPSRRLP